MFQLIMRYFESNFFSFTIEKKRIFSQDNFSDQFPFFLFNSLMHDRRITLRHMIRVTFQATFVHDCHFSQASY